MSSKYEEQCDNWDFRMELATKNMNILADALRKDDLQMERVHIVMYKPTNAEILERLEQTDCPWK